jgi:hypothetical protein
MRGIRRALLAAWLLGLMLLLVGNGTPGHAASNGQHSRAHTCVFDHLMLWTPQGQCRPRAYSYPRTVHGAVRHAIYDGAITFGIPYKILYRIAVCESGLNPRASNGSYFGLFQFAPDTFQRGANDMQAMTGITVTSYWIPSDASYVAGFLFATGQSPRWQCELTSAAD